MIWIISDTHFNHANVINYCNRPWNDRKEMDEALIKQWNSQVKSDKELVYVLGDFCMAGKNYTKSILDRLKGTKILIKGNHDKPAHKMLELGFDKVYENTIITLVGNNNKKYEVYASHFPYHPMTSYKWNEKKIHMTLPDKMDKRYLHKRIVDDGKSWLLHGHVHQAWKIKGRQINCGVDVWDYKLIPHTKIIEIIEGEKE